MSLRACSQTSVASWIVDSPRRWTTLVTLGPAGFPAHARLRFLPDPTHPGQRENDAPERAETVSDDELIRRAVRVLTRFTTTPEECYYLLWDGWGLHPTGHAPTASRGATAAEDTGQRGEHGPLAAHPSAGSRPGLQRQRKWPEPDPGPGVVRLPHRDYYLFTGSLDEFGDWGPDLPLGPGGRAPEPAFVWPADHAWCIAHDVDPHYAGIRAEPAAIRGLLHQPDIDVVPADPSQEQPHYG